MPNQVTQPIAEGSKPAVETVKPMTESDFLASRIAKLSGKPPSEAPAPAEATKEVVSEPEAQTEQPANPSTEGGSDAPQKPKADVLSKDIDELTDEEIAELAQKGKSGLLKRIAELTAKRKIAEEEATRLKAAIAQAQSQQMPEPKVENNPYGNLESVEDIQAKSEEVGSLIEFLEDSMFKAEDLSAEDPAAVVDGKEITKSQLRDYLRQARKARDKYLPAQLKEIQARHTRTQMEEAFRMQARQELPWMQGEDNDTRKQYESMVKDQRLKVLKERVPELAPQMEYILAHAANSMFARRTIESFAENKKPAINPPATPKVAAAAPERADARATSALKDVQSRFQQTGSPRDWIALRTAQLSKRK